MASTVPPQEAVGQPVFVQPDVAPVSPVPVEPGTAYCYPQAQIPGALLLVRSIKDILYYRHSINFLISLSNNLFQLIS